MDMSNKALALLLLTAIVISLGGTIMTLNTQSDGASGLVPGRLNLSITAGANCNVDTNVSLGSGTQPAASYLLSTDLANTNGFQDCSNGAGTNQCKGLQINNTGNVHINVTYSSDANASTLLVSQVNLDGSDFIYYTRNGTFAGNNVGCRINNNTYGQVSQLNTTLLCQNLSYNDGNDILTMEFNLTVEPDISPGTKNAIITISCEQN